MRMFLTRLSAALPLALVPVLAYAFEGEGVAAPTSLWMAFLPQVSLTIITVSVATSLLMVSLSGMRVLAIEGNDREAAKAKTELLCALAGLGICLASTSVVSAVAALSQTDEPYLLIGLMATATDIILVIFNILFALAILYGGMQKMLAQGKRKGVTIVKWAFVGALLVNSSRAIVAVFIHVAF